LVHHSSVIEVQVADDRVEALTDSDFTQLRSLIDGNFAGKAEGAGADDALLEDPLVHITGVAEETAERVALEVPRLDHPKFTARSGIVVNDEHSVGQGRRHAAHEITFSGSERT